MIWKGGGREGEKEREREEEGWGRGGGGAERARSTKKTDGKGESDSDRLTDRPANEDRRRKESAKQHRNVFPRHCREVAVTNQALRPATAAVLTTAHRHHHSSPHVHGITLHGETQTATLCLVPEAVTQQTHIEGQEM